MSWQLLALGKEPQYPLDRRLIGCQSQSGHDGKEKKSLPLPEIESQSPKVVKIGWYDV
jgi:hypothetical protein